MSATTRFSLLLDAQSRGTAEIDKFSSAIDKLINSAEKGSKKSRDTVEQTAAGLKNAIQNPLRVAGEAAEKFVLSFGKIGLISGGVALGFGIIAKAAFSLVEQTGNAAEAILNTADRTGLLVGQVDKLQAMGRIAGVSIESLEASSRILASSLEDTSGVGEKARKALQRLGVASYDATGNQRELGIVTLDVIETLAKVENQAERVALANATLGRGSKELQPLLKNYDELKRTVEGMGFGFDEFLLRKLAKSADEIDKFGLKWDLLKRKLAVPATAIVNVITRMMPGGATGGTYGTNEAPGYRRGGVSVPPWIDVMGALGAMPATGSYELRQLEHAKDVSKRQTIEQRSSAFEALLNSGDAGRRSRLKAIGEEMTGLTPKGLSGIPGVKEEYQTLQREKESIEATIKAIEETKRIAEERARQAIKARADLDHFKYIIGIAAAGGRIDPLVKSADLERTSADSMNYGVSRFQDSLRAEADALDTSAKNLKRSLDLVADVEMEESKIAVDYLRQVTDYQTRRIELLTGPGGEVDAIRQITALRIQAAQTEEERTQVLMDQELDLLALRKRGMEEYKTSVSAAFNSLISGGSSGFGAFLKSQALGIGSTAAGNLAGMTYKSGRLSLTSNPDSFLGKMLSGTPFGADPLKAAGFTLQTAGVELQAAARMLAQSASGGGGGLVSGGMGILSSIPGFGGGSTNGQYPALDSVFGTMGGGTKGKYAGLAKSIGYGLAIAGAGFGVYSGVKAGGAQGVLTATSSGFGAAALIPGPQQPFIIAAAVGATIATMLLGNPKKKRAEYMESEAENRAYTMPTGATYATDIYGRQLDYDYRGNLRPIIINQTINAMDAQTFVEWGRRNPAAIAEVSTAAITSGNADDLVGTLRQVM